MLWNGKNSEQSTPQSDIMKANNGRASTKAPSVLQRKNPSARPSAGASRAAASKWPSQESTAPAAKKDVIQKREEEPGLLGTIWGGIKKAGRAVKNTAGSAVDKVAAGAGWARDKVTAGAGWVKDKAVEVGKNVAVAGLEKGQGAVGWLRDRGVLTEDNANMVDALMEAGKSTIGDHDAHVAVANEFGTTFGRADHAAEDSITAEQAAVLAAHSYNIDPRMIGRNVDVHNDIFGGSIDPEHTPEEILNVEGMEAFRLDDILYNYEEGSGDLTMGVYSRMVDEEREYYLVNMGTNSAHGMKGWKNNFENIDGHSQDMKDSIKRAQDFREAHPDSKITMIGHSKGGGEAAANAVATNSDAIIFNPNTPFLSPYELQEQTQNYTGDMSMYVAEGEILDVALSKVGYRGVAREDINIVEPKYQTPEGFHPIDAVKNSASNHGLDSILYGLQRQRGANE